MSKAVFDSLARSIKEGGGILRGEIKDYESWKVPSRKSRRNSTKVLGVFVGKDDDIVTGKIYNIEILPSKRFLVTDEAGESVICSVNDFLIVSFPPKAERLLRDLVAA
jgi:hypothetical protein